MKHVSLPRAVVAVLALSWLASAAAAQTIVLPLDPRATYLRTNNDAGAHNATAYSLASLGLTPGGWCRIEQTGDWRPSNSHADASRGMLGIFSTSSTLLAPSTLARVPGAVAVGADAVSSNTYFGGLTTDVPTDFRIALSGTGPYSTRFRIPVNAVYVFFSAADQLFYDNSDPDADLALLITAEAAPLWPGTGEDLEVLTGVSAPATAGPGVDLKFAAANDLLTLVAASPFATLANEPALFGVLLGAANAPFLPAYGVPELWIDPFSPLYIPLLANFGALPAGGSTLSLPVPPGLAGLAVVVQSVVVSPKARNGSYAAASAHVVVFL
jgi:hypothetical protein